jgi:hypothetical protein
MKDIVIEYDNQEEQYLWNSFVYFFRNVKGYSDWTDEQIALSMNNDDLKEYCKWVMKVLGD